MSTADDLSLAAFAACTTDAERSAFVRRHRAAQGLPEVIDPATAARLARIVHSAQLAARHGSPAAG